KVSLMVDDRMAEAEIIAENGVLRVRLDDDWHIAELERSNRSGLYSLIVDGRSWEIFARERPGGFELLLGNRVYDVTVGTGRRAPQAEEGVTGVWTLTSPMSGQVVEVRVQSGEAVEAGQTLVVVESMKMNNELTAARAGAVTDLQVTPGERVERGRVMLRVS
ncbi:MAG: acetyl-CoA carboxylase biotin carboxyl carrier protein subunit, partial [Dehalococcoidia bacterium]